MYQSLAEFQNDEGSAPRRLMAECGPSCMRLVAR